MRTRSGKHLVDRDKKPSEFNREQKKILAFLQSVSKGEGINPATALEMVKEKNIYGDPHIIRDTIRGIVNNNNTRLTLENNLIKLKGDGTGT